MSIPIGNLGKKKSADGDLGAPKSPQVNLLPENIRGAEQEGMITRWIVLSVVIALGLVGLWYWTAMQGVNEAEEKLTAAEVRSAQLNKEKNELAYVPKVFQQLDDFRSVTSTAMGLEIQWVPYIQAFASVMQEDTSFTTIEMGIDPTWLDQPDDGTTFFKPYVAEVELVTRSATMPPVPLWLTELQKLPTVENVRLESNQTTDEDGVVFYQTVVNMQLNPDALTGRFANLAETDNSESATVQEDGN